MRDYESQFSRNQAVTASAESDNIIRIPAGDIGRGRAVMLRVHAGNYTGAGSLAIEVQTADNAAMTGARTIASHDVANVDILRGGEVLATAIPTGAREYLRLNYVVTGTLAGGNISAGLQLD